MGATPEVTLLLSILDPAYDRRSWHGTNLRGSNWFRRQTDATEQEWRSDVALLNQAHRSLRDAVTTMTAATSITLVRFSC